MKQQSVTIERVGKHHWVTVRVSKKRDIAMVVALVRHLNAAAGGLRAARKRRNKS